MNFKGIEINVKNLPALDTGFIPMIAFYREFLKTAEKPISIAVRRNGGYVAVFDTFIHGTSDMAEADRFFAERICKFLLWAKGGYELVICGDYDTAAYIKEIYSDGGERSFDSKFMSRIYEKSFSVISLTLSEKPQEHECSKSIGRHTNGCRIGFDAGGSDRKVSAVIDGESVYSEEVVWLPKINSDPNYHLDGILESMKTAASKLPRVDGIGVSSAGIYIDNRAMVASLFLAVPDELFDKKVKDMYIKAAKEIGDVPLEVVNDGDVTALAGAMDLNDCCVLGIAMGTSEAAGYVDEQGNIKGWLNELAFAPVDCSPDAMRDEWSGDIGCGVKYFSQDGVIKLAKTAGINLDDSASPGDRLKVVQKLMEWGDERAAGIYDSIGCYLGHSVAFYSVFYNVKHILLLGRVMSGKGGNLIVERAEQVLKDEYPEVFAKTKLSLPSEKSRRVGQSVTAASLPFVKERSEP